MVAATPAELVSRTMDLSLDLVQTEFSISHERLERNECAKELSQVGELEPPRSSSVSSWRTLFVSNGLLRG